MSEDGPVAPSASAATTLRGIPRRPAMVLIDVDGTLVDSVPDLAFSVDRMMEQLGLPGRGESRVRDWVGNGVERLVKRALTGTLEEEPEPELFERAMPLFLAAYQENTTQRSQLYPGVRETLDLLRERGYKLGCVTNKPAQFTEPLLQKLGIAPYFALVVSGDTLPEQKPDPMPLLYVAQYFAVTPQASLMVGDSSVDVKAARAAGFAVVCVSYGYNHGLDIRDSEPDAVIDSLYEFLDLLD